jgi:AraC-like DNA-binding protein
MLQNTNWLMIFLSISGLLSLMVSLILVFVNKGNKTASKLLGGCLFCLSLWSFERVLVPTLSFFQPVVSYLVFAVVFFCLPPLAFSYIRKELHHESSPSGTETRHNHNPWLGIFSVAMALCWLLATARVIPLLNLNAGSLSPYAASGIILFLCLFLFFHPSILYGSIWQADPVVATIVDIQPEQPLLVQDKSPAPKAGLSIEQSLKYRQVIKDHFATSFAFRKPGYAIRDLSNETGIPGYLLSLFINQEYGMNFNEMINSCRVEYLTGLLKTSFDCESYTLEAIGKMAGFNSRTAFIAAIKKHTGMTPSTFFGRRESEQYPDLVFSFPELGRKVA